MSGDNEWCVTAYFCHNEVTYERLCDCSVVQPKCTSQICLVVGLCVPAMTFDHRIVVDSPDLSRKVEVRLVHVPNTPAA